MRQSNKINVVDVNFKSEMAIKFVPRSLTLLHGVTEQSPTLIVGTESSGEKREEK